MTSSGAPPELTVVVMAFNEVATLRGVVEGVRSVAESVAPTHEIIIVDDGSDDGTENDATALAAADPTVHLVRHTANLGLGSVYRSGFAAASGRLVTFVPADGQFPPETIRTLYEASEGHDAVFGFLAARPDGAAARVLSKIERTLYTWMIGELPRFQGMLMFRRDVLEEIPLESRGRGWAVLMELVIGLHRGGYATQSVLTEVRPRQAGRSKVRNLRTMLANVRQLVQLSVALRSPRRTAGRRRPAGPASAAGAT